MHDHYLDLGGAGLRFYLAPANGFPPEAYQPFAAALAPQLRVLGYRPRPLWPEGGPPDGQTWRDLAADMLADLERVADGPVIGAGHSLGGIMTLYCAVQRPDLFRGVALLEPTIMSRQLMPLIWAARRLGLEDRSPIARGAARRRERFASVDEARARYQSRSIFADFTPAALEGYLEGGLRPDPDGGVQLAWPRAWEAHIFAQVPVDTWDALRRLRVPLLIVRASRSDTLLPGPWAELKRRLPHARLVELAGSHMLPMERPELLAETVLEWIATVDGGRWTMDGGRWTMDGGRWTVRTDDRRLPPAN